MVDKRPLWRSGILFGWALTEIEKSAKLKTGHPAGNSKGAIYKLRLWLLFNQKMGLKDAFPKTAKFAF